MLGYFNFLELQEYVKHLYERAKETRANPTITILEQEDGNVQLYQGNESMSAQGLAKKMLRLIKKILTKEQIQAILNEQAN